MFGGTSLPRRLSAVGLVVGLLLTASPATAPAANFNFSCQAQALYVQVGPIIVASPVANPVAGGVPCDDDHTDLLFLPVLGLVEAHVAHAETTDGSGAEAEASLAKLEVFLGTTTLSISALEAEAEAGCEDGQLGASGHTSIASIELGDTEIPILELDAPFSLVIPGLVSLELNKTERFTAGGREYLVFTTLELHVPLLGITVIVNRVTVDFVPGSVDCRFMTGGGSIFGAGGTVRVTHGFHLFCNAAMEPNRLQVNWDGGNKFHLENLTSSTCTNAGGIDPGNPFATFDTLSWTGTGRCNGEMATASGTFTDAGEPGFGDHAEIQIASPSGCGVSVSGNLHVGNQQAHG